MQSSSAVIFFARDGSASMDQYKCDIVSDMLDSSDPGRCATAVTAREGSEVAAAGTGSERGPAHLSGARAVLTLAIRQAAKDRDLERQWHAQ